MGYEGEYNLEVMEEAVNYNNYLLSELQKNISPEMSAILDFGAGTGLFARRVQAANPSVQVTAVEPAENLKPYYRDNALNLVSSLEQITDASQDLIYSFNVLEHIENDQDYFDLLQQKLRPGGRLVIYVPAFPCLYSAMDKEVGHWRRYRRQELVDKAERAGLKVKNCRYMDGAGWFASLVYKWSRPQSGQLNPAMIKFYDRWIMPLSMLWDRLTLGRVLGKNLWLEAEK